MLNRIAKYTKDEVAAMARRTDDLIDRERRRPGYAEDLAAFRAEQKAGRLVEEVSHRTRRTQKEIARRMRVSQPRISQIATAQDLSLSTIFRYADAAGVRLSFTVSDPPGCMAVHEDPPPYVSSSHHGMKKRQ